ncbi:MAG: clan AA aspartic protease, partial [Gammaproteobacteria bacterium]|nr:clan AA aspartic protease [Gammaproteobacteria bacterium]
IDNGDTAVALDIAAAMRPNYPDSQPWCFVDARAHAYHRSWPDALHHLGYCLDQSSHLFSPGSQTPGQAEGTGALLALYREWVTHLVSDPEQTTMDKVAALQNALDREPDAHLYRSLADIQYTARMYSRAQRNYELAIALDPGLAAELTPRLQTSQQRTATVPLAEIPFESRRGAIIVNGRLNNSTQNFRLMVDTGATYCALSRATLLRLGLHDVFNRGAPVIELESAAGPIYAQRFDLDSMALGPARVNHVPVVLLENLEGVDGLVGLSFLRHFGVALDQQAGKLILTRL